jgi:hypothetical protein
MIEPQRTASLLWIVGCRYRYVARFRAAQVARNRRITAWAKAQLRTVVDRAECEAGTFHRGQRDMAFMVPCTQATA